MLKPIEDKIVLKVEKKEEVTSSGLIMAGKTKEDNLARVVAVGPGLTFADGSRIDPDVKVGDLVMHSPFQGNTVEHDGEEFLIVAYRDILVVIEEA